MKTSTPAVFETAEGLVHGLATYDHDLDNEPWHVYLIKDGEYYQTVGDFANLRDGWEKARTLLGIPIEPSPIPRTQGEGMDGGPFGKEDT